MTDLELARACARGDAEALEEFDRLLRSLVAESVGRALHKERAFVEDVQQALRERLLVPDAKGHVRLAEFTGAGSLESFLRSAAVRTALNLQKTVKQHDPLEDAIERGVASSSDDPELEALKRRCKKELKEAIHAALKTLEREERDLLRLNLLEGESIDTLAVRLKVSRATAARRLVAVRARLLELTREELRVRLRWGNKDLQSVLGLVRSQLDLSLLKHL